MVFNWLLGRRWNRDDPTDVKDVIREVCRGLCR
jgi:hypothetical protein